MTDQLDDLQLDDPLFPLRLSKLTEQRLSREEEKKQLEQLLGYDRPEYEQPDIPIEEVIETCSGIIYKAAAIAQSGTNLKKADLLDQLRRIGANPLRVFEEPRPPEEVIGRIAVCYQRADEAPGTWWMDVTEGGAVFEQIERAASRAADQLEKEKSTRRSNIAFAYLTCASKDIFVRFNKPATQSVYLIDAKFEDNSAFSKFVNLVFADWFTWVRKNQFSSPTNGRTAARYAMDKKWLRRQFLNQQTVSGRKK